MGKQVTISAEGTVAVLREVADPDHFEVHLAVDCHLPVLKCDTCSLQAHCDELFGPAGERCEIIDKQMVWRELLEAERTAIAEAKETGN